jgi:glycosyltransferase involved in cell wall biosynthesis
VILGVGGESLRIISEAGAGIGIEPENADELAEAVRRLADDRKLYARLAAAGPGYVAANFDRLDLAGRFLALLETLAPAAAASARKAAPV